MASGVEQNRAPYGAFDELPISAIRPAGWLKRWLERQRDGLTGHPEASGHPFDKNWWGSAAGLNGALGAWWGPFEQTGYWIDGAVRTAHLLRDSQLLERAAQPLEYVLAHPDPDGYLGPRFLKHGGPNSRWVHAVFFRALMAHHSATGDRRIVDALCAHYLNGARTHDAGREVCNVEPILWAYEQSGDARLLEHAVNAYAGYNRLSAGDDATLDVLLSERAGTEHGVTFNEIGKLGAILYRYTGVERYLAAAVNGYRKLDRDQMLIDGVPSSTEQLQGKDPRDGHETCDIADYTWGAGHLLLATGAARYADKVERACFNAAPGAITPDFRALQYFSYPNQVICDCASNHNLFARGHAWMSYSPNPGTECCPGDVHRIMPNFVARMWLRDREGGLVAAMYGPSAVTVPVGPDETRVTVEEETTYPFSEGVDFHFRPSTPAAFAFSFRVPGWCRGAEAWLNGQRLSGALAPGTFVTLRRVWAEGDRLALRLPMTLALSHWPGDGIGVEMGPLAFSLRIAENWQRIPDEPPVGQHWTTDFRRFRPDYPGWNLYAAGPWNYALELDDETVQSAAQLVRKESGLEPWNSDAAPLELRVPARRVTGWELERAASVLSFHVVDSGEVATETIHGDFVFTPPLPPAAQLPGVLAPDGEVVTLVPYGCTRLRVSVFPQATRPTDQGRP